METPHNYYGDAHELAKLDFNALIDEIRTFNVYREEIAEITIAEAHKLRYEIDPSRSQDGAVCCCVRAKITGQVELIVQETGLNGEKTIDVHLASRSGGTIITFLG